MKDTVTILALTASSILMVGVAGGLVLWKVRRRSLRISMIVAALVPMAAVLAAVVQSVRAMFISGHDSFVVMWALGFSAVLGVGLSVLLGQWISQGSRTVEQRLRTLGESPDDVSASGAVEVPGVPGVPAELAALTEELESTRQRLAASRERARALEASRRELVAFMSHDLRTPLAGLRALSEGLEDGVVDDVPAALRQMRTTVDRMTGLVNDLFELSRLTGDPAPRRHSAVSLRELVEDVAGETSAHAHGSGVTLTSSTPDDGDRLVVHGDPDGLTRAVTNLVGNAIRHTPPGGEVWLTADRAGDGRIRLTVVDECGGIPAEDRRRVFDAGWRGDQQRTPSGTGGGLGLAIAQGVVTSHAGRISVRNIEGGCAFEIDLPGAVVASAGGFREN